MRKLFAITFPKSMKNRILLLCMIVVALPGIAFAAPITLKSSTMPTQFVEPLKWVSLTFDKAIEVCNNPQAYVRCNGDIITKTISIDASSNDSEGTLLLNFETQNLPKGKRYELVVPASTFIYDTSQTNDEISVPFEIPESLGDIAGISVENGKVACTEMISCYWKHEIQPVGSPQWILYRDDVPVRTYPVVVSNDWDLGEAYVPFGEKIKFEKGVRYKLVLPAGAVSAERNDITNNEVSIPFIGTYEEEIEPLTYSWCSLFEEHPSDAIGKVLFYYDMPIMLAESHSKIQLVRLTDNEVCKEVVPNLYEDSGKWILVADFGNYPLLPETGYSIVIPEGTIVTKCGDVIVNVRNVMPLTNENTGVSLFQNNGSFIIGDSCLEMNNLPNGTEWRILSTNGDVVKSGVSNDERVTVQIQQKGVYILSINGKSHKFVIR